MRPRMAERLCRIMRGGSSAALALAGLLWTSASLASPAHFDIDAGDAALTLNEFARQSNLMLLFDFAQLKGVRTQGVQGDMEPVAALAALLAGTSLRFDFVSERTIAVSEQTKPPDAETHPNSPR